MSEITDTNDTLPFPESLTPRLSQAGWERLIPALLPMLNSPDPAVRAPAALLIAKRPTHRQWVANMLDDSDPRVRANVIEGIHRWSTDMHVLNRAVADRNHRVVCNGIVGMYPLDPTRAVALLKQHLTNPDWKFRAAATWACGAIGDVALDTIVSGMRNDPHPSVRWNALRAAATLHRAAARTKLTENAL